MNVFFDKQEGKFESNWKGKEIEGSLEEARRLQRGERASNFNENTRNRFRRLKTHENKIKHEWSLQRAKTEHNKINQKGNLFFDKLETDKSQLPRLWKGKVSEDVYRKRFSTIEEESHVRSL